MDAADAEIRAWLLTQPRRVSHGEMARLCRARFGMSAWGEDRIRAELMSYPAPRGKQPGAMRDPEMLAFINDRIGTMTYVQLAAECRARFGVIAPSKSSLHRYARSIGQRHSTIERHSRGD